MKKMSLETEFDLPIFKPEAKTGVFTVTEFGIVCGFGLVVLAILIPNFLRSSRGGNEAAVQGACKTIAGAQTDYNNNSEPHTYATTLDALNTGAGAGDVSFMDSALGSGLKSDYTFHMEVGSPELKNGKTTYWAWSAAAWPVSYRSTGVRSFYIDEKGIIRAMDIGGKKGVIEMRSID